MSRMIIQKLSGKLFYSLGELTVSKNLLVYKDKPIHISPQCAKVLIACMARFPHPISRDELVEFLWPNPEYEPENAWDIIKVQVCHLRKTINGMELRVVNSWLKYALEGELVG